jgi:hypothetical protein
MKINFLPNLQMIPVQAAMAVIQTGIGIGQTIAGNKRLRRLMKQQTAYSTAQEVFDSSNLALNQAQTGYGAGTLDYLTTQSDRALSSGLGAASRLGANPNEIADIFDRNLTAIMKTGADNELLQMQKFNKVYDSLSTLAEEKTAVWADREAKIKNEMAAAAQQVAAGNKNSQSGLNLGMSAVANADAAKLYSTEQQLNRDALVNTVRPVRRSTGVDSTQLAPVGLGGSVMAGGTDELAMQYQMYLNRLGKNKPI